MVLGGELVILQEIQSKKLLQLSTKCRLKYLKCSTSTGKQYVSHTVLDCRKFFQFYLVPKSTVLCSRPFIFLWGRCMITTPLFSRVLFQLLHSKLWHCPVHIVAHTALQMDGGKPVCLPPRQPVLHCCSWPALTVSHLMVCLGLWWLPTVL
jgi:hypothetical protein